MEAESSEQEAPKFEATPVPVSFLLSEQTDTSNATAEFGQHLGGVAVQLGFPSTFVNCAIVADTPRFGEALSQFGGYRTFTKDHGLVAAAQTIRIPDTKPCQSAIVFNVSVVATVLNAGHTIGWKVSEWSVSDQRNFYVIAHELGHCADHALRPEFENDGTRRDEAGNRVIDSRHENLHAFEFSRLYPELAACVIGAVAYSDEIRLLDAQMNNEALLTMLDELAIMMNADQPDYWAITKRVAATFWFVLMQQAKFAGSRIGCTRHTTVEPARLWHVAEALPAVNAALAAAESSLESAWKKYPEVPPDLLPQLVAVFHQISRACGFSLGVRGGGECVWWNERTVSALRSLLKARAATA